jgi:hypothetical protein
MFCKRIADKLKEIKNNVNLETKDKFIKHIIDTNNIHLSSIYNVAKSFKNDFKPSEIFKSEDELSIKKILALVSLLSIIDTQEILAYFLREFQKDGLAIRITLNDIEKYKEEHKVELVAAFMWDRNFFNGGAFLVSYLRRCIIDIKESRELPSG